ncbi:Tripeptidyl-peptidase sed4 [Cercospora beticola]|uniref:tripeptidyl-peptidase II n=1 Tax=Cercospora beticola TaxID=122368 RepID=A0A2G5HZZ8_CERBT|nr:Tripeptidyl-peptidase sed4 [Cercospora beticola]PIA98116.1 Tripeptidyl-peptidase sed4 [Cercospora beticola]
MLSKLALLTLAVPTLAAIHEQLSRLPYGWKESSQSVPDNSTIHLQIALSYSNLDQLESRLKEISDPGSSQYGQYLDLEDINKLFAPSKESAEVVTNWLKNNGATSITSDGHTVCFETTIELANKMLSANFQLYTDDFEDKLRTSQYSLPDDLIPYIDFVSPTTYFGSPKAHGIRYREVPPIYDDAWQESCTRTFTIQTRDREMLSVDLLTLSCLRKHYNIGDYQADPHSGSNVGFGNFLNQSASYSDLEQFENLFNIPSQNFTVTLLNGAIDNQDPEVAIPHEANLDLQSIVSLIDGLPIESYNVRGLAPFVPDLLFPNISSNTNEPFLQLYTHLLSLPNSELPWVITNSYGDHENTVPQYYAKRICNMIGMLGLRGRTVLHSTGDEGVGAVCLANGIYGAAEFTPQFPPTCPYVTAVGGTNFFENVEAWNSSGGGFSDYFPTPWYQKDAIQTYLDEHISSEAKSYYSWNKYANFAGRGIPDVSGHSFFPLFPVVLNGTINPGGGTSAAVPQVAAIFALLNDARFRAGQPAIGFANPWLYANARNSLVDVIHGGSVGCSGTNMQTNKPIPGAGIIPYASWIATVGWDPVSRRTFYCSS